MLINIERMGASHWEVIASSKLHEVYINNGNYFKMIH